MAIVIFKPKHAKNPQYKFSGKSRSSAIAAAKKFFAAHPSLAGGFRDADGTMWKKPKRKANPKPKRNPARKRRRKKSKNAKAGRRR